MPPAPAESPPPPADLDALIALADRLRPALLRLSRRLRREAERSGLSVMDVQLLAAVYKAPGVSASELADGEKISRPTMSAHVRRLEAAGWIARQAPAASDDDRRRQALHATEAGLRALDEVRRARTDWLVGRLAALDAGGRADVAAAIPALLALLDEAGAGASMTASEDLRPRQDGRAAREAGARRATARDASLDGGAAGARA